MEPKLVGGQRFHHYAIPSPSSAVAQYVSIFKMLPAEDSDEQ